MKSGIFYGLIALQLFKAATTQAQNYYFKIEGDVKTRVADHASWQQGSVIADESLEAYNLDLVNGKKAIGMIRFHGPSGFMSYATHYRINSSDDQLIACKIAMPTNATNDFFVVAEKVNSGVVKSAAVLYYNKTTGKLDKAWELPSLPTGYGFLHISDVMMLPNSNKEMLILCTVNKGNTQGIMELLFNTGTGQYKVRQYKPAHLALDKYNSAYYIRSYHYGLLSTGTPPSFYGMGSSEGKSVAFCFSNNRYEQYNLFSALGVDEVTGVQMNGCSTADNRGRINMAFTDADGDICIQQKDGMTTLNWRQFYHLPEAMLQLGMGRDGHGTKDGNGMHYFIATVRPQDMSDHDGLITTLHYNALNGNMNKPNIWNFSGVGVNEAGGFPNTTNDPFADYNFIADRFNQKNGFKFGTGNASTATVIPCTELHDLKDARNILEELRDELRIETFGSYNALSLSVTRVDEVSVEVVAECSTQQRSGVQEKNANEILSEAAKITMNARQLRIDGSNKTIASLHVRSVDGRLISEVNGINRTNYQRQFSQTLIPGIYVVHIIYTDRSIEVRKVSVQ